MPSDFAFLLRPAFMLGSASPLHVPTPLPYASSCFVSSGNAYRLLSCTAFIALQGAAQTVGEMEGHCHSLLPYTSAHTPVVVSVSSQPAEQPSAGLGKENTLS